MHSSTSGSSSLHATYVLLAACVLVALAAEAGARVGFDRASRIQRRMADEYQAARAIGHQQSPQTRHLLFVGNSLLDEDVQLDAVRNGLGPEWETRRFVVEQTFYVDWYYGLRRLFREGARPDVVVIMLTTQQWARADSRGDYSAHYLMTSVDLPAAARDLQLNATQVTDLALANVSRFWGARAELRNFVLGRLMPDLGRLMDYSSVVDTRKIVDDEVMPVVRDRIDRLKAVTDLHGAQLVILVPAVLNPHDGASALLRAASAAGVPALRPVESGTLPPEQYRDSGFHLNPAGAGQFTARLIPALRRQLDAIRTTAQVPGRVPAN